MHDQARHCLWLLSVHHASQVLTKQPCSQREKGRLYEAWHSFYVWLISGVFRGGKGGCKCTPLWRLVMYFCVHNCTSPSNDYAAVACSNNNQAQLHTHESVRYWSPDVWPGLELLRNIQFGLLACRKWARQPKIFRRASRASSWNPPF